MATAKEQEVGKEMQALRSEEIRTLTCQMTEDRIWDTIQAKDLDPKIIQFVEEQIQEGFTISEIAYQLRLPGGKNGKQWKKIQAYFRQGFRADAEVYLYKETHRHYKTLQKAMMVLEDAFENGTPHVVVHPATKHESGSTEVIRVKGATKELAGFIKAYHDAIALPVKLWKEYGAIGEKKDAGGGVTIVVQNNIPFPSRDEIKKHQDEIVAKAIEVKNV